MTMMRRPILLSMGLHGAFLVLLAVMPLGAKAVFEPREEITIRLIEPDPFPPVIEPAESLVKPASPQPVIHKAVRQERRLAPYSARASHLKSVARPAQANPVTATRAGMPAASASPPRSLERPPAPAHPGAAETAPFPPAPVPSFIEMPRSFHSAGPPVAMTAGEGMSFPTDMITSVGALPSTGIVLPPSRPALAARTGSRPVFRDASAEKVEGMRSKARPGQNVRPDYPRTAREAGWEGTVLLRVEVLPDGRAGSVSVHQTSGHPILDDAALTAVEQWRFIPAMDGSFPLRSVVHLPVRFDLTAP